MANQRKSQLSRKIRSTVGNFGLGILIILFIWQLAAWAFRPPSYILPSPLEVINVIFSYPLIWKHFWVTVLEAFSGLGLAIVAAFILAVASLYSSIVRSIVFPVTIAIQVSPKIALAPLFLLWFGYGLFPKILIATMVAFFPLLANIHKGLGSLDKDTLDLFKSLSASQLEILFKARIPTCLPYFFTALKTAAGYSVIGAVIGEFVGASRGMGYLIMVSAANLQTSLLFASLLVLVAFGLVLYISISLMESTFIKGPQLEEEFVAM